MNDGLAGMLAPVGEVFKMRNLIWKCYSIHLVGDQKGNDLYSKEEVEEAEEDVAGRYEEMVNISVVLDG